MTKIDLAHLVLEGESSTHVAERLRPAYTAAMELLRDGAWHPVTDVLRAMGVELTGRTRLAILSRAATYGILERRWVMRTDVTSVAARHMMHIRRVKGV